MIRRGRLSDIAGIIELLRRHHVEKQFDFKFNPVLLSSTVTHAMTARDWLCLVGERSVLIASYFDSPFGAGRLAMEHIVRAETPGLFAGLIKEYEQWAVANGCVKASLSCTDRFSAFTRLYSRHGYRPSEMQMVKHLT